MTEIKDMIWFEAEKKFAGVVLFLCCILGGFVAHRFYMGRPHAVTMVVITLISIPLCLVLVGFVSLLAMTIWVIADLCSVSKWVREHNTTLLAKISSTQG